jgi:hypothetical protein
MVAGEVVLRGEAANAKHAMVGVVVVVVVQQRGGGKVDVAMQW